MVTSHFFLFLSFQSHRPRRHFMFFFLFIFVASMSSGLSLQFLVLLLLLLLDIKNSLTVSLVGRWAVWSEREWERASDIDFMGISWTKEYCCCSSLPFCAVHNAMMTSLLLLVSRCASYTHKAKWGRDMRMVINRDLCLVVQWDQHQAMNFFFCLACFASRRSLRDFFFAVVVEMFMNEKSMRWGWWWESYLGDFMLILKIFWNCFKNLNYFLFY